MGWGGADIVFEGDEREERGRRREEEGRVKGGCPEAGFGKAMETTTDSSSFGPGPPSIPSSRSIHRLRTGHHLSGASLPVHHASSRSPAHRPS